MSSSLETLLGLGRKASIICGESGSDEVLSDVAYFLCTATQKQQQQLASKPSTTTAGGSFHIHDELYDLQRGRIASGAVAVAFTASLSRSAPSLSSSQSSATLHRAMDRTFQSLPTLHRSSASFCVWVEDMGEVGAHMVFRNAGIASQWISKAWHRLQQQQERHDASGTTIAHVVFHFTLSHAPPGLLEGPFQQFLHMLDAAALSFKVRRSVAASLELEGTTTNSSRSDGCFIVPSVLVECATPLVASVGREKLAAEMSISSSPRIVVASIVMQRQHILQQRHSTDGGADDNLIGLCLGASGAVTQHPRNAPLCLFLRDAISVIGAMPSRSAMQVLLASWCVAHSMEDVVMMLHLMTCTFDLTLGGGGGKETSGLVSEESEESTVEIEESTHKLFKSISCLAKFVVADTYEAQAVGFACIVEAVSMGTFIVRKDLRALVEAHNTALSEMPRSTARSVNVVTVNDLDVISAASSRQKSIRWLSASPWRHAVAMASLEEPPPSSIDDILATACGDDAASGSRKRPFLLKVKKSWHR